MRPSTDRSTFLLHHITIIFHHYNTAVLTFSVFIFFLVFVDYSEAVRVVALNVPAQVRKGSEVELICLYDLGNASLYSLKWFYRVNDTDLDEQEFFRFTPSMNPRKQYFPLDGINVNVNKSEKGRLVMKEINGKTTGKYKCEISVDGTFQTVAAEKLMTVLGTNSAHRTKVFLFSLTTIMFRLEGLLILLPISFSCIVLRIFSEKT